MPDFKIDPLTGDIATFEGRPLTVSGVDHNAQRIDELLNTIQGEWFWDVTRGIPFFDGVLGKLKSKAIIDSIYYNKILDEPYIDSIIEYTSEIDGPNRTYASRFIARDTSNKLIGVL